MKKSLMMFGLGAAAIVGLSSCQSTNSNGGYSDFEEAMPMSDLTGNGELPPWVLEGSDDTQIAAGETTRNHYPVPDDGLTDSAPAKKGGWFSQNQEELATNTEDVIVEDAPGTPTPVEPTPVPSTPVTHEAPTQHVAVNTTTKTPAKPAGKNSGKKQKVAHFDKPTMVKYTVKKGDNLTLIAKRSNTTIEAIRKASKIKGDKIVAGQTIMVPYTPNSYKMAQEAKNGKGSSSAKSGGSTYTVKKGDTISAIAARNGVSTKELLAANGLSAQDASKIRPGRHLTIPGKAAAKSSDKSSAKKTTAKSSAKKNSKKGKR